ncbi:MAG: hypothetical protein ABIJ56_04680 [Pseudomonadota bacterium]
MKRVSNMRGRRARRKRSGSPSAGGSGQCPCCGREASFFWSCPCGLRMCQPCMDENAWGLTCNHVTWTCPDCGRVLSY